LKRIYDISVSSWNFSCTAIKTVDKNPFHEKATRKNDSKQQKALSNYFIFCEKIFFWVEKRDAMDSLCKKTESRSR